MCVFTFFFHPSGRVFLTYMLFIFFFFIEFQTFDLTFDAPTIFISIVGSPIQHQRNTLFNHPCSFDTRVGQPSIKPLTLIHCWIM